MRRLVLVAVSLVVVAVLASRPVSIRADEPTPALTLDQDEAPVGTTLTLDGTGFDAWVDAAHGVTITAFDADGNLYDSGEVAINEDGTLETTITTDNYAPGDYTLGAFSPDGTYVLGHPAYRDGIGDGQIALYTETGRLLVNRQTSDRHPGFYQGATWEDATHVLFPVFQAEKWSLVRMSVTGAMEYAIPPAPGTMDHNPFTVATTP